MRRFLIAGESILDVIAEPGGRRRELPGGSPANVAVGLARLGHDVGLWTHIGADPAGVLLRDHLTTSGVELLAPIAGVSSRAVAEIRPDGSARYDFSVGWPDIPAPTTPATHLHTGSIAALMTPDIEKLLRERRPTTTISYDPNIRPALAGDHATARARVERLVALSDVVKASDEDLAWLYPNKTPLEAAHRWQATGPALVCVTRGEHGAFTVTENLHVTIPPTPVDVIDTVGAGDAFMSGLLDALHAGNLVGVNHHGDADQLGAERAPGRSRLWTITGDPLRDVLERAALVAALTVARAGASPPTRAELRGFA
ncbi:carbohydrate kinase [Actinoplanes sp. NPDC049596]|uniref:carbohydrate kinase family protein n=1 Tax=unclassified Actinoplanes TaxID=2626549 RepID=UPI0034195ED3